MPTRAGSLATKGMSFHRARALSRRPSRPKRGGPWPSPSFVVGSASSRELCHRVARGFGPRPHGSAPRPDPARRVRKRPYATGACGPRLPARGHPPAPGGAAARAVSRHRRDRPGGGAVPGGIRDDDRLRRGDGACGSRTLLVGAGGFEPPTLCTQSRCATRLRYAPRPPYLCPTAAADNAAGHVPRHREHPFQRRGEGLA